MRSVKYTRHDYRNDSTDRNEELHRFLLDIPYLLYFGVVPSRAAINEFLKSGGGDGGMGPGASWEPFEITEDDYWEILERWDQMDGTKERDDDHFRWAPPTFIQDYEIMSIPSHDEYKKRSRKKYESLYFG